MIKLSIIILHYRATKELFDCLDSIKSSKARTPYEVIVVDNDQEHPVGRKIKAKYKWVRYVKSEKNAGFGGGNNIGAKAAKGELLFFLNADTIVFPKAIDTLVNFLIKNKKAGFASPLLLHKNKKPFDLQGLGLLNPLRGIICLSFINKLFPNNPISKNYWLTDLDKTRNTEADVIPGTAMMIRRDLFEQAGGFDDKFFIYFEEFDFCKRILEKGYKNYFVPGAKIIHLWESSTKGESQFFNKVFARSRFYYFEKHFGFINALIVEAFARSSKNTLFLLGILTLSSALLFYRLNTDMMFIGDQGWFYLSARDMVLKGNIPLVGIASSHPWIHQGAWWTYLLGIVFWVFRFNPLSPGYFTALLGVMSVLAIYKVGSVLFSKKIGLLSALLSASSPLIVMHYRMPYHIAPIPLLTTLYIYSVYRWVNGRVLSFPLSIFLLAFLYNFEIATFPLFFVLLFFLILGIWKKTKWVSGLREKKIIFYSGLAYILPMVPMVLYDLNHGFPQTLKFVVWLFYRVARLFGFPSIHANQEPAPAFLTFLNFSFNNYGNLIFPLCFVVSGLVMVLSLYVVSSRVVRSMKERDFNSSDLVLASVLFFTLLGYFVARTPSFAYLPVFFPTMILAASLALDKLMTKKILLIPTLILFCIIVAGNVYFLISTDYLIGNGKLNGPSFSERLSKSREIVELSGKKEYNLLGKGIGSEFRSFTMNYEYLTWWLGHGPSEEEQAMKISVEDTESGIVVKKESK